MAADSPSMFEPAQKRFTVAYSVNGGAKGSLSGRRTVEADTCADASAAVRAQVMNELGLAHSEVRSSSFHAWEVGT